MEITYIYGLFDPRTLELRYIGKSDDPKHRLCGHIYEAKRDAITHKDNWILQLLKEGIEPSFEILEECTEDTWQAAEIAWIAECRKFGLNLTNLQNGGENPPNWDEMHNPEEAKKKVAESNRRRYPPNKGRKWDEEYKNKMSMALSGKNNPMWGKFGNDHPATGRTVSDVTKQRLSEALAGENNPMFGKVPTKEHRQKISLANKGRPQSESERKKKSLAGKMCRAFKKGIITKVYEFQAEYFELYGVYHPDYPSP